MQMISRQINDEGVAVLTFDRPESAANVWDRATLEELQAHLHAVAQPAQAIRGLLLRSAKPAIFMAGVDLRLLGTLHGAELSAFIELGHNVFNTLASLPMPTVAAIHGAALGGGYEVALACDWRVATGSPATRVGLPETTLGILPFMGGCARLPRLVGLPRALELILEGALHPAEQAKALGLVDQVVPEHHLLGTAQALLLQGKRRGLGLSLTGRLSAPVAASRARAQLWESTRGLYPAQARALEVVVRGATSRLEGALALERTATVALVEGVEQGYLLQQYFQKERARKLAVPGVSKAAPVARAAVLGASPLGAALAQRWSAAGTAVLLQDPEPAALAAAPAGTVPDGLTLTAVPVPLGLVDLAVEAGPEDFAAKRQALQSAEQQGLPADAVLATTSGVWPLAELGAGLAHPERLVGLWFARPVGAGSLVEIKAGAATTPEVLQRALHAVQKWGHLPVLVKDGPGTLTSRVELPMLLAAVQLWWEGADLRAIAEAARSWGLTPSPWAQLDALGWPTVLALAAALHLPVPEGATTLAEGRQAWLLPRPSGEPRLNPALRSLRPAPAKGAKRAPLTPEQLTERLVLPMLNAAVETWAAGVAEGPADLDLALVLGGGFGAFRGGPLRYVDAEGAGAIVARMEKAGLAPGGRLREMVASNGRVYDSAGR